jgi:hypothetical protein
MKAGTYRAIERTVVNHYQGNSIGSQFHPPRLVEYELIEAGKTFMIPETVNGYYYGCAGVPTRAEIENGQSRPAKIERID